MRRLLLVLGVCTLLWAAADSTPLASPDHGSAPSDAASSRLAGDLPGPGDSEGHWRARRQTNAATESVWKSAPVHAALAAARFTLAPDATPFKAAPAPSARSAPSYLRHTPLLI